MKWNAAPDPMSGGREVAVPESRFMSLESQNRRHASPIPKASYDRNVDAWSL
jgi:hypothetical protein